MKEFVAFRPKTYCYLMYYDSEYKKAKGRKKCVIKRILKFNDYKDCLLNNKTILISQQRCKSETHCVYTKEINEIALSSNDDKRVKFLIKLQHIHMEQALLTLFRMGGGKRHPTSFSPETSTKT